MRIARKEWNILKAVAKLGPVDGALELIEATMPELQPGMALIEVNAAGICGTDLALWRWQTSVVDQYNPTFPVILGHEFSGTVAVPSGPRGLPPGTLVGINPQISCRRCFYCSSGNPTLCMDRSLMGARINGGWAEFVAVPEENLYALPPGTQPGVAPLLEPLCVAAHAVLERVPPMPGDVVAVVGAGPIGLLTAILALDAGAGCVMVTGINGDEDRLRLAGELGAIPINIKETDPAAAIRHLQADGADVIYETSGSHLAIGQAVSLVRRSGRVGLIGLAHTQSELLATPVVLREISLIGSRGYNETTWSRMARILPRVQDKAMKLISHKFPLSDFEEGLKLVSEKSGVNKVILTAK